MQNGDRAFSQAFGKTDLDTQRGLRIFFDAESIEDARRFSGEIGSAGGLIAKELPSAVSNAVDQTARLKAALGDAADSFARPINDAISSGIQWLLDDEKLSGTELLAGGGDCGRSRVRGAEVRRAGALPPGRRSFGQRSCRAWEGLGKLPLPLPVYVVNDRMSLTSQALSDMAGGGSGIAGSGAAGKTARAGAAARTGRGAFATARNMLSRGGRFLSPRRRPGRRIAGGCLKSVPPLPMIREGRKKAANVGGAAGSALGGMGGAWAGARRRGCTRKCRSCSRHGHRRRTGRRRRRTVRKRRWGKSWPHDCRRLHQPGSGKSPGRGNGQAGGKSCGVRRKFFQSGNRGERPGGSPALPKVPITAIWTCCAPALKPTASCGWTDMAGSFWPGLRPASFRGVPFDAFRGAFRGGGPPSCPSRVSPAGYPPMRKTWAERPGSGRLRHLSCVIAGRTMRPPATGCGTR